MDYFFNKGLLYMEGEEVCFYDVGANVDKVKREPDLVEGVMNADVEELRKEMAVMREELGGVRKGLQEIKGSLDVLAERSTAQNGRMTDAVKLMKRMAEWLEEKFSQRLLPGPGSLVRQPGLGSSSLQRPPPASKPLVTPLASVSTKKPLSKTPVIAEEEEPESPAKKKVKMNRPNVPSKSGSQGGQTQN